MAHKKCVPPKWHVLINGIILEEERALSKDLDSMRSGKGPTTFVLVNVTSVDSIFEQQIPEVYSECRVGSSIMSKRLLAYNLDHNSTEEHKTQLRRVAYTSPRVFILTLRFVLAFLIRAIEKTHTQRHPHARSTTRRHVKYRR